MPARALVGAAAVLGAPEGARNRASPCQTASLAYNRGKKWEEVLGIAEQTWGAFEAWVSV